MAINLDTVKRIHFVGIKGVGMTALALCAQDLGIEVSGSDTEELFVTDEILKKRKILVKEGFDAKNLGRPDLVIATAAFGREDNPEIRQAKRLGIPLLMQGEALGIFTKGKETVAVCGVGGKSTTSAAAAAILERAGRNSSYAVGVGEIFPIGAPGKFNQDTSVFVCEADEYANLPGIDNTAKFLYLDPKVIIVTNIEHDHPDIYPSLKDVEEAYLKFFRKIPSDGLLVANVDNQNVRNLISNVFCPVATYGLSADADYRVVNFKTKGQKIFFDLIEKSGRSYQIESPLPGVYNALNLAAAAVACRFLGLEPEEIVKGIDFFKGTKRRFERAGETTNGVLIIDDYAHHPKEIASVLEAARQFYADRRLVAVFQPHTYSRTKVLFEDFAKCFGAADLVGLMDIYSSAREKKDKSVSLEKLAEKTTANGTAAFYTGGHKKTILWLKDNLKGGDVLMTLGAGDIFYIHDELVKTNYLHKQFVVSEL